MVHWKFGIIAQNVEVWMAYYSSAEYILFVYKMIGFVLPHKSKNAQTSAAAAASVWHNVAVEIQLYISIFPSNTLIVAVSAIGVAYASTAQMT